MGDGWIGVDLDGTLAYYDHWRGIDHIGEPIPAMAERVRRWLAEGLEIRIVTARVSGNDGIEAARYIQAWGWKHFGVKLRVTNRKDFGMIELWDDRAIQVVTNTGERLVPDLSIG
jgi:hypothetical protein